MRFYSTSVISWYPRSADDCTFEVLVLFVDLDPVGRDVGWGVGLGVTLVDFDCFEDLEPMGWLVGEGVIGFFVGEDVPVSSGSPQE